MLSICQGHIVHSKRSWLGPHHRVARCRERWRRRLPSKTGIGAHRSLVPRLATLEADDLRPGLALRSRRPREGWSRARALLNWDGRAGKSADNCPPLLELLPLWLRIWNPGLGLLVHHHCRTELSLLPLVCGTLCLC